MKGLIFAACAGVALGGAPQSAASQPVLAPQGGQTEGLLPVTVDAATVVGRLKPLDGARGWPIAGPEGGSAVYQKYKEIGIGLIRTHDSGAGELDAVYSGRGRAPGRALAPTLPTPHPELTANSIFRYPAADPNDPASYNFGPTDALIHQILATGAQPLFRLGRSAGADPDVPKDFEKWATVAANIVRHYNKGWANGFHYGIKYWEVWNEPDFSSFWQGGPEDYYELYRRVATAIKTVDSDALVGGPTVAWGYEEAPYGKEFVSYVEAHNLPLDFYSWHWYSANNDPYDYARVGQRIRGWLDYYGYYDTRLIVDEWNSSLFPANGLGENTATHAAFIASALAYMQTGPVDEQAIYGASNYLIPHTKEGDALTAWMWMKKTPVRLATTGNRTDGFAVVAGKSDDGRLIQVFVSNFEAPAAARTPAPQGIIHFPNEGNFTLPARQRFAERPEGGYSLTLSGLTAGRHLVKQFRLSDTSDLELLVSRTLSGTTITLPSDLKPESVEVLQITDAE